MKSSLLAGSVLGLLPGLLSAQTSNAPPAAPAPVAVQHASTPVLTAPAGKVSLPPGQLNIANEPIVKVIDNVMPAVVNITADGTVPEYYSGYGQFFRRYTHEQSIGSGLIISADGFVLTNAHVVELAEREKEVSITLKSGSKYKAQIVEADSGADLALLKIEDHTVQYPYFDLNYVSPNLLGETVVAMGSPAGYQSSASHGILSAKGRNFEVEGHSYKNLLQTDAAINPGNSGGPLVDLNGSLVGINSAKLSGPAIENIGFAIPHDVVVPWATDAMAVARGQKPAATTAARANSLLDIVHQRLGLVLTTLTDEKAAEMQFDGGGMLVTSVDGGSPAADANLHQGMVIVGMGNHPISDEKSLPPELKDLQPGDPVRLQVVYLQQFGGFSLQRGGSVVLTAR
jgi:S1-C subfamily serine protease